MENGFFIVILIGIVLSTALYRLIKKESERTFQDEKNYNRNVFADDNSNTDADTLHSETARCYDEVKATETAEQTSNNQDQNDAQPDTFGLMFNTLCNIGCQPSKNDDGTLSVQYQGENFLMHFGGMYAHIWDPMWAGIKADDPDLPQIREAVNIANFNFGPTTVMSAPDENGIIGFHSHRGIMLHPACPDNDRFVSAVLDSFFEAKQEVRNSYHKLNIQQTETRRNRRPVGFSTPANPETPPSQNDN